MSSDAMAVVRRLLVADSDWTVDSPTLPDGRDMRRYLVAALAGAVPCIAAAAWYLGPRVLAAACVAFAAMAAVETAFGLVRRKPAGGGAFVYGILFALMLPPATPMWMVAAGAAFGALFGKEAFGGTGHHVFNPVLVGKAFLVFSYPSVATGHYLGSMLGFEAEGAWQACSALIVLGGVAVCVARPSNALALAGTLTAGAVTSYALWALGSLPFDSPHEALLANGFLYGACFLACDPATCPGTHSGKLLHGFIVGSLAVVIRSMSNYHEGMLSAILIANVFAPTINMMGSSGISSNSDPGTPAYEGMPLRDEE